MLEVQSDKAADTITSRFAGVIKKLHAKQDDTVKTGSALCDIDVEGESEESEQKEGVEQGESNLQETATPAASTQVNPESAATTPTTQDTTTGGQPGKHSTIATPAVRGLLKEHNLDIRDIRGTGKDGRVLKEDVYNHISPKADQPPAITCSPAPSPTTSTEQTETPQQLTPVQQAMFRTMTASLQIPHFLYADDVDITSLSTLRKTLNNDSLKRSNASAAKLTYLPFILKALSLSLHHHPLLNSRLDLSNSTKPQLIHRSSHNIGIACDTPSGLLVPVIRSVQSLTIPEIASEIARLSSLARAGKLSTQDLTGGTITVSNIGNLGGGTVLAPIIIDGQVAILGIGKSRAVPMFDEDGKVVRAELVTLSWSADHRVVDGASIARAASMVKGMLEEPGRMLGYML